MVSNGKEGNGREEGQRFLEVEYPSQKWIAPEEIVRGFLTEQ